MTTGAFALWFVGPTPLERVRSWAGQVLQPGHPGAWECVSTEPLPRVGHHASVTLARTTWRLGLATLVQVIAEEGGNPRAAPGGAVAAVRGATLHLRWLGKVTPPLPRGLTLTRAE